jgi:HlyD family secretion protein
MIMRTKYILIPLIIFLFSCNINKEKSDAYGNFETDKTIVSAESNGIILKLEIEEGDRVKKDQQLGLIDTIDLHLKKSQILANIKALESNFANINSQIEVSKQQKQNLMVDKNRIDKLFEEGAATQKQKDDISGKLKLIEKQIAAIESQKHNILAQIEATKEQLKQLNRSISKCKIINPIEGVVLTKLANPHELANMGKPLYTIANTNYLNLKVYISGAQLPYLIDKNKTENQKLKGEVIWISEDAEFTPKIIQTKEERVSLVYAAKVRVKNNGEIKIGMPGEINFMNK